MPVRRFEEQRLFREYSRTGSRAAREALVERYLPLARSLARRLRRGREPLEDLEQVASLALINAIDAFDPERGTAFSSFAVPSIVGALKRHYRDVGWFVRPPRVLQELSQRVQQIEDELAATTGSAPTAAQIAAHANTGVEEVLEARAARLGLYAESLERPRRSAHDGDGEALADTLGARDEEIRRAFERVTLDTLLRALGRREREVVRLYYREELTQAEIGARLGYSQMHISRLLRRGVEQLLLAGSVQESSDPRALASGAPSA
jgi:RNA polymerase sigma-B factor